MGSVGLPHDVWLRHPGAAMIEEVQIKVVRHVVRVSVYRNDGTSSLRHHYDYVRHFPSKALAMEFVEDMQRTQKSLHARIQPPTFNLPASCETAVYIESMSLAEYEAIEGY